jgi:integrase
VHNVITPLQALYGYAKKRGKVMVDPTDDLELPEVGQGRTWLGTPEDARALLDALPDKDRALWATAFYAGLRRGELRALRVSDIQEDGISVERSWDDVDGEKAPKSRAGVRVTLLPEPLRALLARAREAEGDTLIFGRTATEPFTATHIRKRAHKAWKAAGLEPVGLHECRHGFSSFMDAAGISEERADRYMGHSRGTVASRYRHLLRGQLQEDARTFDDYLNRGSADVLELPSARQLRDSERQCQAVSSGFKR